MFWSKKDNNDNEGNNGNDKDDEILSAKDKLKNLEETEDEKNIVDHKARGFFQFGKN